MYNLKNVNTFAVTVMIEKKGQRKPVKVKPQQSVKTEVLTEGLKGLAKKNILRITEETTKKSSTKKSNSSKE